MKAKTLNKNGIKSIKIEYVLAIILTLIIVVLFLSNNFNLSIFSSEQQSVSGYQNELEAKIENLIKKIDGAGKTNVIITTDGTSKEEVLKESVTTYENGVKKTVESVVMINGKPYVIKTYNPNVLGVVVVCEGANNLSVKLAITEILTTTLNVDYENIKILKMKW